MGTGVEEVFLADLFMAEAAATVGAEALAAEAFLAAGDYAAGLIPEFGAGAAAEVGVGALASDVASLAAADYAAGLIPEYGGLSWADKAATAFSDLGKGIKTAAGVVQPYSSLYSGYKALTLADEMKKRSAGLASKADPWGASGGRAAADAQLQELNKNPTAAMAGDPRYAAMVQAAQRATAMHGQDSGAMAAAGAQAGGNWYTQRMAELSGLAGANANPAAGVQAELSGLTASNDLYSRGLASIGYGTQRLAGTAVPPEVQRWLQSQGMNV